MMSKMLGILIVRISTLFYSIGQGFKNIGRHKMYSLASMATMASCVFMFGVFFLLLTNVNNVVKEAEKGIAITVFFDEEISDEDIEAIGEKIEKREEVSRMEYVSPDQAWDEFQVTYFEDSPELAEGFADDNPLANSGHYEVYLQDVSKQKDLVEYVEAIDGVRKINQSEDVANMLTDFNKFLTYVSFAITGILLAVSMFLICNTIVIGINSRKDETSIMKLIGATNSLVRMPFLIEGIIIGIIGSIIPLVFLYYIYEKLSVYLSSEFNLLTGVMQFLPSNILFAQLVPITILFSVLFSFICSFMTTRKHLKV